MPQCKLFPTHEDIFVDVTDAHRAVFFPLLTIDLASINKGEGKLHFVSYFRNGEEYEESPFVQYNFIAFKVVNDKYLFEGNFKKDIYLFEQSSKWYEEAKLIYGEHKEKYLNGDPFIREEDNRRKDIDFEYYYYIKSILNYWVTRDMYLETGKFIQGTAYTYGNSNQERDIFGDFDAYDDEGYPDEMLVETLMSLGLQLDDLKYIGQLAGYNYYDGGPDVMQLFINKTTGKVFQYYSWS